MLSYSAPPGYRRTKPVRRPKLEGFTDIIDAILEADADPEVPRKQRHTAYRIFERLRDEHGFTGGYTIVKNHVRARRQSVREAFVPLYHPPGLFRDRFGRPAKGNDKGKVAALVKTARRKFMVPIPRVPDLDTLNERLMARCPERLDALQEGERAAALLDRITHHVHIPSGRYLSDPGGGLPHAIAAANPAYLWEIIPLSMLVVSGEQAAAASQVVPPDQGFVSWCRLYRLSSPWHDPTI